MVVIAFHRVKVAPHRLSWRCLAQEFGVATQDCPKWLLEPTFSRCVSQLEHATVPDWPHRDLCDVETLMIRVDDIHSVLCTLGASDQNELMHEGRSEKF